VGWAIDTIERSSLDTAVDQAADGIVITDRDGKILFVNPAFTSMTGYSSIEAVGQCPRVLKSGQQSPAFYEELWSTVQSGQIWQGEVINRRKDGTTYSEEMRIAPVREPNGEIAGYIAIKRDITERMRAQEASRATEERYRVAFQTNLDAMAISRVNDGTYVEVNNAFVRTLGYENKEVIGRTALELDVWAHSDDRLSLVEMMRNHTTCRDIEAQFRRKNGEVFWGLLSVAAIELDGIPCLLSVLRDVSDAKVVEKEIKKLAFFDPLTGLSNRRQLIDQLGKTPAPRRRGRKRALLFIDLDDFKTLNDTIGHKTGDLMLQEIASRLTACLREADTVARQSGDEFVVLLEDLSESPEDALAQARAVAEKILTVVGQPLHLAAHECRITSCIGVTVFGSDPESANEALQQAEIAMYQAKAAGRNSIDCFVPALQAAVNARASMVADLRNAISLNQFLLYYQPQMDGGHLVGVEALLRWKHPKRGIVPPNEFIPLAEETLMILPLGDWVLETACKQIAAWAASEETAHITVSVNISAHQFRQPNFVEQVLASLESAGADSKNLKLELTESILVKNIEDVIAKMSRLKSCGVRFSVDDFGTGYSSLTYLKRLPLDQLKIDRSFIHDILMDIGSGAIAQSIISLSNAMGFSVIAEGVETEEQRELLAHMGCNSFQGYLFSKPLPAEEFELLLAAQRTWRSPCSSNSGDSTCPSRRCGELSALIE
jgi:diguanylate cyclase (GGDEF)-like protein/PAS domain S-box-containing protein